MTTVIGQRWSRSTSLSFVTQHRQRCHEY